MPIRTPRDRPLSLRKEASRAAEGRSLRSDDITEDHYSDEVSEPEAPYDPEAHETDSDDDEEDEPEEPESLVRGRSRRSIKPTEKLGHNSTDLPSFVARVMEAHTALATKTPKGKETPAASKFAPRSYHPTLPAKTSSPPVRSRPSHSPATASPRRTHLRTRLEAREGKGSSSLAKSASRTREPEDHERLEGHQIPGPCTQSQSHSRTTANHEALGRSTRWKSRTGKSGDDEMARLPTRAKSRTKTSEEDHGMPEWSRRSKFRTADQTAPTSATLKPHDTGVAAAEDVAMQDVAVDVTPAEHRRDPLLSPRPTGCNRRSAHVATEDLTSEDVATQSLRTAISTTANVADRISSRRTRRSERHEEVAAEDEAAEDVASANVSRIQDAAELNTSIESRGHKRSGDANSSSPGNVRTTKRQRPDDDLGDGATLVALQAKLVAVEAERDAAVTANRALVAERQAVLAQKDAALAAEEAVIIESQDELAKRNTLIHNLYQELNNIRARFDTGQGVLKRTQEELRKYVSTAHDLGVTIQDLRIKCDQQQGEIEELHTRIEEQEARISGQEDKINEQQSIIDLSENMDTVAPEMTKCYGQLTQEYDRLKATLDADQKTADELEKSLDRAATENRALESANKKMTQELEQRRLEIDSLKHERTAFRGQISELQKKIVTLGEQVNEIAELRAKSTVLQQNLQQKSTDIDRLRQDLLRKSSEVDIVKQNLLEKSSEVDSIEHEKTKLTDQCSTLRQRVQELDSQFRYLRDEEAKVTGERTALQKRVQMLETELSLMSKLRAESLALQKERDNLTSVNTQLSDDLQSTRRSLLDTQKHCKELETTAKREKAKLLNCEERFKKLEATANQEAAEFRGSKRLLMVSDVILKEGEANMLALKERCEMWEATVKQEIAVRNKISQKLELAEKAAHRVGELEQALSKLETSAKQGTIERNELSLKLDLAERAAEESAQRIAELEKELSNMCPLELVQSWAETYEKFKEETQRLESSVRELVRERSRIDSGMGKLDLKIQSLESTAAKNDQYRASLEWSIIKYQEEEKAMKSSLKKYEQEKEALEVIIKQGDQDKETLASTIRKHEQEKKISDEQMSRMKKVCHDLTARVNASQAKASADKEKLIDEQVKFAARIEEQKRSSSTLRQRTWLFLARALVLQQRNGHLQHQNHNNGIQLVALRAKQERYKIRVAELDARLADLDAAKRCLRETLKDEREQGDTCQKNLDAANGVIQALELEIQQHLNELDAERRDKEERREELERLKIGFDSTLESIEAHSRQATEAAQKEARAVNMAIQKIQYWCSIAREKLVSHRNNMMDVLGAPDGLEALLAVEVEAQALAVWNGDEGKRDWTDLEWFRDLLAQVHNICYLYRHLTRRVEAQRAGLSALAL